jgi:hypothetical protein
MVRLASLSAAMAALVLAPAAMAKDDAGATREIASKATPVKLVSFNGAHELLKKSARMRIWRTHIGYTLGVDAEGKVTSCELTEKFRQRYVTKEVCALLSANHTFEPARDANNAPVAGTYTNTLSYAELRAEH